MSFAKALGGLQTKFLHLCRTIGAYVKTLLALSREQLNIELFSKDKDTVTLSLIQYK